MNVEEENPAERNIIIINIRPLFIQDNHLRNAKEYLTKAEGWWTNVDSAPGSWV